MAPIKTVTEELSRKDLCTKYAAYNDKDPYEMWDGGFDTDEYLANLGRRISKGGLIRGTTSWATKL